MFTSIKADWAKFEAWIASWLPGAKTKITAFLGAVGNVAYWGHDYLSQVTGLPSNVVTGEQVALFSLAMFTLAYWFRGLGDRVAANVGTPSATS